LAAESSRVDQLTDLVRKDLQTASGKLDETLAALSIAKGADPVRQILEDVRADIRTVLAGQQKVLDSLAEMSTRIRPPVIPSGADVLATEVQDIIVGVPGNEWRMAAYHAFRGPLEPGLTKYFRRILKPELVVVDVGANVGFYTLLAAKQLQGHGKIYSFEPTPRTYRILRDNVQINGLLELGMIELYQLAVTDRKGSAQLSVYDADCGHNTLFGDEQANRQIEVSTTSLDEILEDRQQVDIVKIDAEGAEPLVFRGMRGVIQRNPAIRIVLEFAPSLLQRAGTRPLDFLREIESAGFDVRRIHDEHGDLLPATPEELTECFSVNLQLERLP